MGKREVNWYGELRCPESRQTVYYPQPRCNLNDKLCVLAMDGYCPFYEDYLLEVRQDEEKT